MSFRDVRQDLQRQAHVDKTASVLLEKMEDLRNSADGPSRRRWVWELIQNAVDVARPNEPLHVDIDVKKEGVDSSVVFTHNGRPFTLKNLVYLAEQVSTKERHTVGDEVPDTVGRFGTGFLTTHLLSEKVEVRGACAGLDGGAVAFMLPLDRSGGSRKEMAEGVQKAMTGLDNLDTAKQLPASALDTTKTTFTYHLGKDKLATATAGLSDLHALLPYTLAFGVRIGSVTAITTDAANGTAKEGESTALTYRVASRTPLQDGVERVRISIKGNGTNAAAKSVDYIVLVGGHVTIALPATVLPDGNVKLQWFSTSTPRLHCAFPLVGSEGFPFPAAINCVSFHPTEKRNGVWLGAANTPQVRENWSRLSQAKGLLDRVVKVAVARGWVFLAPLADFGNGSAAFSWLNGKTYDQTILQPLRATLKSYPLVEASDGTRKTFSSIWFPCGAGKDERKACWDIALPLHPGSLPATVHIEAWECVRWVTESRVLTEEAIYNTVSSQRSLSGLAQRLNVGEDAAIEWLNSFLAFLSGRGFSYLTSREYGILPNQYGQFLVREKIYGDNNILESLKDLGKTFKYDIRQELLDQRVKMVMLDRDKKSNWHIAAHVSTKTGEMLRETRRTESTNTAFRKLLEWMLKNNSTAAALFGDIYECRHRLQEDKDILEGMEKGRLYDELTEGARSAGKTPSEFMKEVTAVQQLLSKYGGTTKDLEAKIAQGEEAEGMLAEMKKHNCTSKDIGTLKLKATKHDALMGILQECGVDEGDLKSVLMSGKARMAAEVGRQRTTVAHAVSLVRQKRVATFSSLAAHIAANPSEWQHIPQSDVTAFLDFLALSTRAKAAVRERLSDMDDYDCTGWTEVADYPTIIKGVKRRDHGKEIVLVVRPSDGNQVIMHYDIEPETLTGRDAELWVQDNKSGVQQVTLGMVLKVLRSKLDINKFPLM